MTRWEYVTVPVVADRSMDVRTLRGFEDQLNELGGNGWELVGFVAPQGTALGMPHAVMKRPVE